MASRKEGPSTRNAPSARRTRILKLTLAAVLAAFSYVVSAFLPIPYPGGAGYFSFGDAVNILSAMLLGPYLGAAVGALAGLFSDLTSGYLIFIPFTLVSKASMGLLVGFLWKQRKTWLKFLGLGLGPLAMVLVYALSYYVYYGLPGLWSCLFDLAQGYGGAVIAYFAYLILKKTGLAGRLLNLEDPVGLQEVDDDDGQDEHQDVA